MKVQTVLRWPLQPKHVVDQKKLICIVLMELPIIISTKHDYPVQ
jgi:hypothetical protein